MFNNFLFWWVNCGTPANANTFYWKPKIKCTLLENSSKTIACVFHFLMKIALFICMLTVTCISFGASVRQVVKVWISKSWWCSKVRVCMIRRLFGAYECVIHAQLWNLHFRLWGVCVVMMYCSHVTACVYIRRWTGGEVNDDAGAAVQKQRLPPLPWAGKRTEWVNKKRLTRLQRWCMAVEP